MTPSIHTRRLLRPILLSIALVATVLGIQAAPASVELPLERPDVVQPLTALAVTCATNPLFTGRITETASTTTAANRIVDNVVFGYISDVDQAWSCTASIRYSALAWNTTTNLGTFNWGNLINSTSVACNWLVGTTDYLKANSTSDCADSDAEYAMAVTLSPQGVYQADNSHDGVGDFSFAHADCDTYHGAEIAHTSVSFSSGATSNRPASSNCDPVTIDGTGTTQTIINDRTGPTGAVSVNGGNAYATSATTTLALSATDAVAGVKHMRFSNDGTNWSAWETYGASKAWTLTAGQGTKTVRAQFRDHNDNESVIYSDTIYYDTADPTGSITIEDDSIPDGATYTTTPNVSLALTYQDTGSGPYQMQFRNESGAWSSWEPVAATKAWTLSPGDGTKTVGYQVKDNAGRTSSYSDSIILDVGDPIAIEFVTPAAGTVDAQSGSTYPVGWLETGGPVASRSLQQQVGDVVTPGTCGGISWQDVGEPITVAPPIEVTGLENGNCYRWVLTALNGSGEETVFISGAVLVDASLLPFQWSTANLNVTMATGTSKSTSVNLVANERIVGASLSATPQIDEIALPVDAGSQFDLADGDEKVVEIAIEVPLATSAGTYQGEIDVTASGQPLGPPLAVTVEVVAPTATTVPDGIADPSRERIKTDASGDTLIGDQLIVGIDLATSSPEARIVEIAQEYDAVLLGSVPSVMVYELAFPAVTDPAQLEPILTAIEAEPDVRFAATDYVRSAVTAVPNDPEWDVPWQEGSPAGNNWHLEMIRAPSAWEITTGDPSIPVAIIDYDIVPRHEDLQGNFDVSSGDRLPADIPGHGTHVAGIACAEGNNEIGVSGVAWQCSLRRYEIGRYRFVDPSDPPPPPTPGPFREHTTATKLMEAMTQAISDGARIVNMSWGFGYGGCDARPNQANPSAQARVGRTNKIFESPILLAERNGWDVLWVAAAGNEKDSNPCDASLVSPASLSERFPENFITVASVDDTGNLSNFSADGDVVSVAAPGGSDPIEPFVDTEDAVFSTLPIDCPFTHCTGYGGLQGTSQSAPQVTGLAALVLSEHPTFSSAQVKGCIVDASLSHGRLVAGHSFRVIDAPTAVACSRDTQVVTNDEWKTLELSWQGGTTNPEPAGWQNTGFDDSSWSPAYIPTDPYHAWVDIPDADWLSSTGRATGHLTGEIWIARLEFQIDGAPGDATLSWNVDNQASIWINGTQVANHQGTWSQIQSTPIDASLLQEGANTIAVKVFQDNNTNSWSVNPTFFQSVLAVPTD